MLVQVAINLVLVAVLYVGDKLLLSAMEILAKTQTDPLIVALPESILVDIVIGGIGVAGVILGLYCSNMTSVYSSKYTNAPATISSVFQRDVVTNRCIKQITGYIIFCVIILFGCLIGISFSYVSIIALLFLTIRMIITFSITGNRMYQLSNTFNISDNLYPEIYSALRKISANNHFSNDPNFQNHYQKICTKQFKILQDIAAYNKDNPINQNPAMLSFINNNLALISVYWGVKEKILEMSRNVQSGNTQNLKSMVIQRSFPKWSVAERRKTAAASDQAAVCACAHSRYFTGGSPSGLRV